MSRRIRTVLLAAALAAAGAWMQRPTTVGLTTLSLRAHGPDGETVQITGATLFFDWWGGGQPVPLKIDDQGVVAVDLDAAWVTARWPNDWWSMEGVRLYVEAAGYAPKLSDIFKWIGTAGPGGAPVTAATISFIDQTVTVAQYDRLTLDLAMRRPRARTIRLVDQSGRPAGGLHADIYMYWTRANHCGVLEGRPLVHDAVSSVRGVIAVPDGDFEYGVSLSRGPDQVVFDDEPVFYQKVVALKGVETDVVVRRFAPRTMTVRVTEGDRPASGVRLVGYDRYAGCQDPGIRPLGVSDRSGRVAITFFDPDHYNDVVACRDDREIWRDRASVLARADAHIVIEPAPARPRPRPIANPCARSQRLLRDYLTHAPVPESRNVPPAAGMNSQS